MIRLCSGIVLSALITLAAGTSTAFADTYTYNNYNVPYEQTIQITSPNDIYGGMGQIDLVGTGTTPFNIPAWCLDIYTYLLGNSYGGAGPFTYNITTLTDTTSNIGFSADGTTLTQLSDNQIGEIGGLIAWGNAHINDNANVSAATQLAIWETEYGSVFTFTGVSQDTIDQANLEKGDLGTSNMPLETSVGLLTQGTGQDNQTLAYFNPGPNGSRGVPGPIAGAGLPGVLFFGGMGGLIWRRRRRREPSSPVTA